jgi:hypothetical protein
MERGPVSLFADCCSRCHGPSGVFYGESFARLNDAKLQQIVSEMMKGPAGLTPTPVEEEAMLAYNRSLRDKRPFVCIRNGRAVLSARQEMLRGEVTPGATVVIVRVGSLTKATVEGATWTLANAPRPPFQVVATSRSRESRFTFPAQQWSEGR